MFKIKWSPKQNTLRLNPNPAPLPLGCVPRGVPILCTVKGEVEGEVLTMAAITIEGGEFLVPQ